ncbi:LAQU0S17e01750g1_1 [Lachancea quebecensis]|uniref:LAQU0S17e01750g1_1 n=1 Tax=Lachancea quebecensis TaxID=1654605 RepID=A0A0P1KXA3_9SACH|nr:LAQU0S17e01750g1_1 [Lachancea quebecensis]
MALDLTTDQWERVTTWVRERSGLSDPEALTLFQDFILELLRNLHRCNERKWLEGQLSGLVENPAEFLRDLGNFLRGLGASAPPLLDSSTRFVLVAHVPYKNLNAQDVRATFAPFGAIVSCRADVDARNLLIQFQKVACAIRCTKAATLFFNNRFVTVDLYHSDPENFGSVWLIGGTPSPEVVDSNPAPLSAAKPSPALFNDRVQQVQAIQQNLFEQNQRSAETYKQNFSQLFESKEKLLRAHQSALQELKQKILATEDPSSISQTMSEFQELQKNMESLGITPTAMVQLKLQKFNLDDPSQFPVESPRALAVKQKRTKKAASFRRKLKRRR